MQRSTNRHKPSKSNILIFSVRLGKRTYVDLIRLKSNIMLFSFKCNWINVYLSDSIFVQTSISEVRYIGLYIVINHENSNV